MNAKHILDSGSVIRYHATLVDKKQNVAEHSWEAAIILMKIYPEYTREMMEYTLTHDCAEIHTSDVAAPVKRKYPVVKEAFDEMEKHYRTVELDLPNHKFTPVELLAMKYADILSGVYFCHRRHMAGDRYANKVLGVWFDYINNLEYLNDEANDLLWEILRNEC